MKNEENIVVDAQAASKAAAAMINDSVVKN